MCIFSIIENKDRQIDPWTGYILIRIFQRSHWPDKLSAINQGRKAGAGLLQTFLNVHKTGLECSRAASALSSVVVL